MSEPKIDRNVQSSLFGNECSLRKFLVVNNMFQIKTSLFGKQTTENGDTIARALSKLKLLGCNDWVIESSQKSDGLKSFKEEKLKYGEMSHFVARKRNMGDNWEE